ncbi:hypothetical protein E2562_030352 [Oryza meyeriana var. granulata]|uniref:Uncharacterized protein n=1 Tax=Oryza meyeriana var. granulata TaxID=110450 RepID=A0A6G1DQ38_9ORYZ|nr:hypothetical protein E2562_030352 [Oryza meyeriana var. granulata]
MDFAQPQQDPPDRRHTHMQSYEKFQRIEKDPNLTALLQRRRERMDSFDQPKIWRHQSMAMVE